MLIVLIISIKAIYFQLCFIVCEMSVINIIPHFLLLLLALLLTPQMKFIRIDFTFCFFNQFLPGDPFRLKEYICYFETVKTFVHNEIAQHKAVLDVDQPKDYIDSYLIEGLKTGDPIFKDEGELEIHICSGLAFELQVQFCILWSLVVARCFNISWFSKNRLCNNEWRYKMVRALNFLGVIQSKLNGIQVYLCERQ